MPKYKSRKDRVHAALRMFHGIGCEEMKPSEIAKELDVRVSLVNEYIYDTQEATEIRRTLDSLADQTRKELIMEKRDRLRQLRDLEEQLKEAVEVVVTDFTFQDAQIEVTDHPGDDYTIAEDEELVVESQVPVPDEVTQVPQFERLRAVWSEMRQTEEEIARIMGLEEPDEVRVTGDVTEQKHYKLGTDPEAAGFPEQEISELTDEESV